MKKLIAMAAVAMTMMMASCSGDDSESTNNPSGDGPLVTKIVVSDSDGTYTTNLTYNGNKVVKSEDSDGSIIEYSYTGNKLTKIEYFWDGETISQKDTFAYNNDGALASYTEILYDEEWGNYGERTEYTYVNSNTITTKVYLGDDLTQTELDDEGIIIMQNGNVMSYHTDWYNYDYTFDNKNSIDKNVFAADILRIAYADSGVNNVLTEIANEYESTHEYTYNSQNYPVTETVDYGDGDITTYTYHYN